MRRILPLILWQFGLLAGGLFADVVTLKDGRQISGSVESGNIQEIHIKVGDRSQTIDIHEVQAMQFGALPASAAATPSAAAQAGVSATVGTTQSDTLILKDGTHVTGRWWSIDAGQVHFLVNNQLQHYPRQASSAVTFGGATLPQLSNPTPPSASSAQPPVSAAQPARAPTLERSSAGPPPPTLKRPTESAQPSAPPRALSQPEEIGAVYFLKGKALTPLEHNQAAERRSGSTQYWEMPAPQSRVRLSEAASLVFIVRLPPGVDPASYSLFPLVTVNGSRRTKAQRDRRGVLVTWPVDIEKNNESSLITYSLTVRDLPTGEYSFSPSNSNDGYCFGVDASAPGQ